LCYPSRFPNAVLIYKLSLNNLNIDFIAFNGQVEDSFSIKIS